MKIFITTPGFGRHGGIRIILEWANRLTAWHDVYLHSLMGGTPHEWFPLSSKVKIVGPSMQGMDCLIITSPHAIDFQDRWDTPKRVFIFMQMVEHLFKPHDKKFVDQCTRFYTSPHPMFHGSRWGYDYCAGAGRTGKEIYIPNGVNLDHFPLCYRKKDHNTVLVESWEASNPAKDVDHIAPRVAERLKKHGFKIIAYGALPLKTMRSVPDEYHPKPSLAKLNRLYERATILLKATKYDARALAPMEAGTKGTVTARAIILGDDDLVDGWNCEKTDYSEDQLYNSAVRLLGYPDYREKLATNMEMHIRKHPWDSIMNLVNIELCQ